MAHPAHLAAAQAAVAAFARDALDNRLTLPGRAVPVGEPPAAVERARAFYCSVLTPPDDSYGVVLVSQLPADAGAAFLVVGYSVESRWGAAEVYSPEGDLWASGVYVAATVGWHDSDTVRAAMLHLENPATLIPRPDVLEWIDQGPGAYVSTDGRFFVHPAEQPTGFVLNDRLTRTAHECDTFESAHTRADELRAPS